jgi:hypothetical protein
MMIGIATMPLGAAEPFFEKTIYNECYARMYRDIFESMAERGRADDVTEKPSGGLVCVLKDTTFEVECSIGFNFVSNPALFEDSSEFLVSTVKTNVPTIESIKDFWKFYSNADKIHFRNRLYEESGYLCLEVATEAENCTNVDNLGRKLIERIEVELINAMYKNEIRKQEQKIRENNR